MDEIQEFRMTTQENNGIQLMQLTIASLVPCTIDYSLCEKLLMNNS